MPPRGSRCSPPLLFSCLCLVSSLALSCLVFSGCLSLSPFLLAFPRFLCPVFLLAFCGLHFLCVSASISRVVFSLPFSCLLRPSSRVLGFPLARKPSETRVFPVPLVPFSRVSRTWRETRVSCLFCFVPSYLSASPFPFVLSLSVSPFLYSKQGTHNNRTKVRKSGKAEKRSRRRRSQSNKTTRRRDDGTTGRRDDGSTGRRVDGSTGRGVHSKIEEKKKETASKKQAKKKRQKDSASKKCKQQARKAKKRQDKRGEQRNYQSSNGIRNVRNCSNRNMCFFLSSGQNISLSL